MPTQICWAETRMYQLFILLPTSRLHVCMPLTTPFSHVFFRSRGFKEVCQILVENGADYTLQDNDKDTPLTLTDDEEIKRIIKG